MTMEFDNIELESAIVELCKAEIEKLNNDMTEHVFSESFEKKMINMIRYHRMNERIHSILKHVAIVILSLGIMTAPVMAFNDDVRAAVYGWVKSFHNNYILNIYFNYEEEDRDLADLELTYIPEGLEEWAHDWDYEDNRVTIYLESDDDVSSVTVELIDISKQRFHSIYGDVVNGELIEINGISYEFYSRGDKITYVDELFGIFEEEKLALVIYSNISKEETIKIVEGVRLKY